MLRRLLCLFCCAVLAVCAPFQALAETFRMAGFDGDSSNHAWNENDFFKRMQDRTGIDFTFEEYTDYEKWQAAKQAMAATGVLPDVLFKAELTTREQIEYRQSGLLIDLKPLLPEAAPNLWALLQAHPDWLEQITLPDGSIVALPSINELPVQNAMWINREWLDTLGLAAPTDWDSLVAVLKAFQTGDPNHNGSADEIPLSFLGPWDLKFLAHAFGLVANDYNVYLDADGAVRFMPAQDGYLDFLRALADLYAQGLLDGNGFTTSDAFRTVTDEKATVTYGLFFGPNPMNLLPYQTAAAYELLAPLAFEGNRIYRELVGPVQRGAFAVTSACADPAALLRWADVLYTEEGAIEAMAGISGKDYIMAEDGRWDYAGNLQSLSSYILYDLSLYDTGTMPWLFPQDFYNRYSSESIAQVNAQLLSLRQYVVTPFPAYTLTPQQEDRVGPLQQALGRYVDESLARFVTGEWDIRSDKAIEAYRTGLTEHGEAALVEFWQEIADASAN